MRKENAEAEFGTTACYLGQHMTQFHVKTEKCLELPAVGDSKWKHLTKKTINKDFTFLFFF